jgi:ankyrin repeat protein
MDAGLLSAVISDNIREIKRLISEGVDVKARSKYGSTFLHLAACNGKLRTVKYLVEEKEVDVKEKNNDGSTPLHFAADDGRLDMVKYFIEKGIDVNIRNNYGVTPLRLAALHGHLETQRVKRKLRMFFYKQMEHMKRRSCNLI